MSTTYTSNLRLAKPADGDAGWGATLRADVDALDAVAALGGLAVVPAETPSASLNVKVAGGRFVAPAGAEVSYAGTASQALTLSASNYVYLTPAGVLTVSTSSFPATAHLPLAVVTTDATTVTAVADRRPAFRCVVPGGPWLAVRTATATDAATIADGLILADAAGGTFTVTLPTPVGISGKKVAVKRTSASNNVTVATAAGTFDGAATKTLGSQYASVTVVSNNVTWSIVGTTGTVT